MEWYVKALKKYAVFTGRARRKEYWMFVAVNFIFSFFAIFIDSMLGIQYDTGLGLVYGLYSLAVLLPGLAVSVRRLHDVGKSGWMLLVYFIPIIGMIWLFVLSVRDGQPGVNVYGPNPKV